jgi:NADH-quinone oxidoreductase subunit E
MVSGKEEEKMALSNWDNKAQATFDKIMEAVPEAMREAIKPQLIAMIEGKAAGSPVTVEVIEKMVREDLPEPQRSMIMGALGLSDAAPPKAATEAKAPELAQLSWEGGSKRMVEKILGVIPDLLRSAIKTNLLNYIKSKAGASGAVTESLVIDAIYEMKPPEPYMNQIMRVLAIGAVEDLSRIDDILSKYQKRQEELVPVFHEVQKEYGHLSKGTIYKVSEYLNVPLSKAYRVATSYQAFSLEAKEKHVVKVCDGIACHLKHSDKLYEELKGIPDGRFTVEKVRCLGCCGQTTMVMADDECGDSNWARGKIAKF